MRPRGSVQPASALTVPASLTVDARNSAENIPNVQDTRAVLSASSSAQRITQHSADLEQAPSTDATTALSQQAASTPRSENPDRPVTSAENAVSESVATPSNEHTGTVLVDVLAQRTTTLPKTSLGLTAPTTSLRATTAAPTTSIGATAPAVSNTKTRRPRLYVPGKPNTAR